MIHATYTWTEHSITCRSCHRATRIAAEVVAELREAMDFEGQTDAQVAASIESCNECIEGPNPVYEGEHASLSEVADRLIAWVADAAFDCGEWDSDDENHTYEELHAELKKAKGKFREFIAEVEARAAATTLTARDLFAIHAGLEVGRGVDEEEPWPGLDDAIAKVTTIVEGLTKAGAETPKPETSAQSQAYIDGAAPWPEDGDDTKGVLGALNSQYEPEHEAPSADATGVR